MSKQTRKFVPKRKKASSINAAFASPFDAASSVVAVLVVVTWLVLSWPTAAETSTPEASTAQTGLSIPAVELDSMPIEGDCEMDATRTVQAPDNWMAGCRFVGPGGGVAIVGHSIIGPRIAPMERIGQLSLGDEVLVDGKSYSVVSVEFIGVDQLPEALWAEGSLSLITCEVSGEDITENTVIGLQAQ